MTRASRLPPRGAAGIAGSKPCWCADGLGDGSGGEVHKLEKRCTTSATACTHVQVDSVAVQVKFFERHKGRVFHHPSSVNFNCGRFESGWLIYTDMVETSKVRGGPVGAACRPLQRLTFVW